MSEDLTMRECLLRDIHDLEDQRDFAISEMERLERESEELRAEVAMLKKCMVMLAQERNEAREEARRATYDAAQETIKVSTVKSHWIEACRERDEAREAFAIATSNCVDAHQRLREIEREAREAVQQ